MCEEIIRNVAHQHGGIIGEAEQRHKVGQEIDRHDEVSERCQQRAAHAQRRVAVERAVIGGDRVFRERDLRGHGFHLGPELFAHARSIALAGAEPAEESVRVESSHRSPLSGGTAA
jgi:hypothetical protein